MARETVQQKRDREFWALTNAQLESQRIDLEIKHANEIGDAVKDAHLEGWHNGHLVATNKFASLSWWERLTWKAER